MRHLSERLLVSRLRSYWLLLRSSAASHLLVLDHDFEPLLKVLLHAHAAALEQVLDALDLSLKVLKLRVFGLVALFVLVDPGLDLVLFFGSHKLAVVIHHASQRILLPNLLDLVRQIFDALSGLIDIGSELFASGVLFLEKGSILLHGLILAVALSEHVKRLCPVG